MPTQHINCDQLCIKKDSIQNLNRLLDKAISSTSDISSHPIDRQDLLYFYEELQTKIIPRLEESQKLYIAQFAPLEDETNQVINSRQQSQLQSSSNTRITFPQTPMAQNLTSQSPKAIGNLNRSLSHQSQKINPNRRSEQGRSHKRTNVTHSDRSRSSSTNSNNIWIRAEPFFAKLPSNSEFEKIFLFDSIPAIKEIPSDVPHWSTKLQSINCRANGKAVLPPGPPSSSDDMAEYWIHNRPYIQVEKMQKSNSSPLHCLLNAFVDLSPHDIEEIQSKKNQQSEQKVYAPLHSLLPHIDNEGYLQYDFDARLNLELESLGLNAVQGIPKKENPFKAEVKALIDKVENVNKPTIQRYHDDILPKLEEYRKDQQKRNDEIGLSEQNITEYNMRKRKRKE